MVRVDNKKQYKIGDEVWWIDRDGNTRHGKIYEIRQDDYVADGVPIALIKTDKIETGARLFECWPSHRDLLDAEARRAGLQRNEYKGSIETVEDLVRFMFEHDMEDEDARAAASERAKGLLGIDMD